MGNQFICLGGWDGCQERGFKKGPGKSMEEELPASGWW